jgi:anionic cell wall polymer biosynthesis LytR-Cps2A-Psr (LCP) family protein
MARLLALLAFALLAAPALAAPAASGRALGADGRYTILLLGSDLRGASLGKSERTDALMVVSVEPVSGATTLISIPRDTEGLPLPPGDPDLGAASSVDGKVNTLFESVAARLERRGLSRLEATRGATAAVGRAIGYALGIEIDDAVIATFAGFTAGAKAIGPVEVEMERALYTIECGGHVSLAKNECVDLQPDGKAARAKRTVFTIAPDRLLPAARTRHADSDFYRAARQQRIVVGMAQAARTLGPLVVMPALLALTAANPSLLRGDLDLGNWRELWAIMGRIDPAKTTTMVFTPPAYGTVVSGGSYHLEGRWTKIAAAAATRWPVPGLPGLWPLPVAFPPPLPSERPAPSMSRRPGWWLGGGMIAL